MPRNDPLVSILVRSMDRPTLERALRSAATQAYANLEIVVVAACGPAHRPLPASFMGRPLSLVRADRPLARSEAANRCLEHASGAFLNFLDDDDELLPAHVGTLMDVLRADRRARLAFGVQEVLDASLRRVAFFGLAGPPREHFTRLALFEAAAFGINAALFDRGLVDQGARFDTALACSEDHDFWIQCAQRTRFAAVNRVTSRWHGFVGDSGGGWGPNWNADAMRDAAERVRSKWSAIREAYLETRAGRLEAAYRSLCREDTQAALAQCENVLASLPSDPLALKFAALANVRAGNLERAERLISGAVALRRDGKFEGVRAMIREARLDAE